MVHKNDSHENIFNNDYIFINSQYNQTTRFQYPADIFKHKILNSLHSYNKDYNYLRIGSVTVFVAESNKLM